MQIFSKKKWEKFFSRILNSKITYLAIIALILIQFVLISFILVEIKNTKNEIVSLNLQFIRLNNDVAGSKTQLDNIQNILLRLQAQVYRLQSPGENTGE